jgi:hypothetical protein
MSLVSRLIKTLNDAIECKRDTTERRSSFVSRFRGVAKHTSDARASITGLPARRDAGNRAYEQQRA